MWTKYCKFLYTFLQNLVSMPIEFIGELIIEDLF